MQEFLSLPGVYCLPILKKSHPGKKQEWHHSHCTTPALNSIFPI